MCCKRIQTMFSVASSEFVNIFLEWTLIDNDIGIRKIKSSYCSSFIPVPVHLSFRCTLSPRSLRASLMFSSTSSPWFLIARWSKSSMFKSMNSLQSSLLRDTMFRMAKAQFFCKKHQNCSSLFAFYATDNFTWIAALPECSFIPCVITSATQLSHRASLLAGLLNEIAAIAIIPMKNNGSLDCNQ